MLFSCTVLLIAPDPGDEILSAFSFIEFQNLPIEGRRLIFKPKNSKPFYTLVHAVIPVLDLEIRAASTYLISLEIISTEKNSPIL